MTTGLLDPSSLNPDPSGWTFGFHGGVNAQWSAFVVGAEADLNFSGIAGSTSVSPWFFDGFQVNGALTTDQSLNWFSTFRGRFGVAAGGMLFFGTGGIAVGGLDHFSSLSEGLFTVSATSSDTQFGWALGGGAEGRITNSLLWRVQFLAVDLGETDAEDDEGIRHVWKWKHNMITAGISFKF